LASSAAVKLERRDVQTRNTASSPFLLSWVGEGGRIFKRLGWLFLLE